MKLSDVIGKVGAEVSRRRAIVEAVLQFLADYCEDDETDDVIGGIAEALYALVRACITNRCGARAGRVVCALHASASCGACRV